MLQVTNLTIAFGSRVIMEKANFALLPGNRVGLVGKNGAGKSTLLKAIDGDISIEGGNIAYPSDYTIGFLKQEIRGHTHATLWEEARSAFDEAIALEKKLHDIEKAMETRDDYTSDSYMKLTQDLVDFHARLDYLGYYDINENIERILRGLGFSREDFQKAPSAFSGGWAMRIELAKILLQKPDLLLLDEPTNHLDIDSILWLERFLSNYEGAVLLVSHDRTFLDNVTNRTFEVELGKLNEYKASYSKYVELKEERQGQQLAAFKNQQDEIKQIQRNIDRFKAKASKASFAQSLAKKLDRMDIVEVDVHDNRAMRFNFPIGPSSGKVVVEVKNAAKSYGKKHVFDGVNLLIEKGEKVAFVGKNGMGKTTLARIIAGEIEASSGEAKQGYNVAMGYFAQHHAENLPKQRTILEHMEAEAPYEMVKSCRNILGAFLFSGEDVDKKISVLSGGERARVCLAQLLLQQTNFLILDEPTNHLDMVSKDRLKQAISEYTGTVIIVSHDRDFLAGLTDKVFEFDEGKVKEYLGDISEFFEYKKMDSFREYESDNDTKGGAVSVTVSSSTNDRGQDKEFKKIKNQISKIESRIQDLEKEVAKVEVDLANFYNNADANKLKMKKEELEKAMAEWEEMQMSLESLG
ncbi:MAG: ABC-F family ATP-binding cassette domain-containing protein [Chitinophagales bacterium]|nr:ABC-F family ATP-binding cassette domain-containing protein [Chitinophagales bacterium]